MLIYSKERLVPTDVNMMVIAGMNGYFYVHRTLYDQAVILDDIYCDDHALLIKAVTNQEETRDDVEEFFATVPRPINIFAPYLLLVKEQITNIVDMIGAIHAMSGPINLRKMLKVPFEMRNTPSFSLSIRDEYQLAWDRFCMNTMPFASIGMITAPHQPMPMNGTMTETAPVDGELTNVGDDGNEYADPLEALLYGASDDIFDLDDEDEEDEDEEDETPAPIPAPTPAPTPVPVTTPEPSAAQTGNGLDLLRKGIL